MTGYQEILTDPSYSGQAVVMTYPLIGNYGVHQNAMQNLSITPSALLVKEIDAKLLNWIDDRIPVITGIDTRFLTQQIRDGKIRKCAIFNAEDNLTTLSEDLGQWHLNTLDAIKPFCVKSEVNIPGYTGKNILVIDCGMKHGILQNLAAIGHNLTIIPHHFDITAYTNRNFDAIFISNGAGDPRDMMHLVSQIKQIIGNLPIFGVCMGHQILSLALGCEIYKMPFGNRGPNHPVQNLESGRVFLTSQNHSYAVKKETMPADVSISYINLNDGSIEGITAKKAMVRSVQFHPEACPGTKDAEHIFMDWFSDL